MGRGRCEVSRVLVDCDGVLAQFLDHVLIELNDILSTSHVIDDITQWEMYDALNVPEAVRRQVDDIVMQPGFCACLPSIAGAREGLDALRDAGHKVYCLTTPFKGSHWMPERVHWLRKHMGFNRKEVIFCHAKELVQGDFLIDDKVENLQAWEDEQQFAKGLGPSSETRLYGHGILFDQPWNKQDRRWLGKRARNWQQTVAWIEQLKNGEVIE